MDVYYDLDIVVHGFTIDANAHLDFPVTDGSAPTLYP